MFYFTIRLTTPFNFVLTVMDYFAISRKMFLEGEEELYSVFASKDYQKEDFSWIQYNCKTQIMPAQGWKIHIAATSNNADQVLAAIFELLIYSRVTFKHVGTKKQLLKLNHGDFGISQIGKFVTIYPSDEKTFLTLLVNLDHLTVNFKGPTVFSDRSLSLDSIVHYRYGGFISKKAQNQLGIYIENIIHPITEELIEDVRDNFFILPKGLSDPVVEKLSYHVEENGDITNTVVDDRYIIVSNISFTFKTRVYLALDIKNDFSKCIIKIANSEIEAAKNITSCDLIENEAYALDILADCEFAPKKHELSQYKDTIKLVMTYFDGISLHHYIRLLQVCGIRLSNKDIHSAAVKIALILEYIHNRGIVHGDLKTSNIIIGQKGKLFLIDYETAVYNPAKNYQRKMVTRGYGAKSSTQSSYQTDIYAFASILYSLITGHNPSDAIRSNNLQEIPMHFYHPSFKKEYEVIINNCWLNKYASIKEVLSELDEVLNTSRLMNKSSVKFKKERSKLYFQLATQTKECLLDIALKKGGWIMWESKHTYNSGLGRFDINIGSAGIILFLCQSHKYTPSEKAKSALLQACYYLIYSRRDIGLLGLYVGEAGIRLSILHVALLLKNDALLNYCIKYAYDFTLSPSIPCDLFNGLSGIGLYFLFLYQATKNIAALERAEKIATCILKCCNQENGEVHWPSSTGEQFLGFAHGIAGIGYFFVQLYSFIKNEKYKETCICIHKTLCKYERSAFKGRGLNWPNTTDGNVTSIFWCHGAVGIGKFYLALYEVLLDKSFLIKAEMAGRLVANFSAWLNVTQCHGVAGNIEYLLDLYQVTKKCYWKNKANKLAIILQMKSVIKEGYVLWPSEDPFVLTPDYMVGFSGVASCLLRISKDDFNLFSMQYLISLECFQETQNTTH